MVACGAELVTHIAKTWDLEAGQPAGAVPDTRWSGHAPSMICVLGMHRAGTSATTGALSRLGLHVGPPERLMPSRDDNPAGFFEHQALSDLNDEILRRLGGTWDEPPALRAGWQDDPGLGDLRDRARGLLREDFGAAPLWAWKDPRTCLTLPFWQPLLPGPRYVLCVRNPLDVARSLQVRNGFSIQKGVTLWMQHMTSAVRHLTSAPVLVVAYNDLLDLTEIEVGRLAAYVGPHVPSAAERDAAIGSITATLRHQQSAPADLFEPAGAWHDASAFYVFLRSLAALQRDEGPPPDGPSTFGSWLALYARRSREGIEARHQSERLQEVLEAAQAEAVQTIDGLREELDVAARVLETTRAESDRSVEALRGVVTELERARAGHVELLRYLETPVGALKVAARAWLPAPVHARLRRWGLRWMPGLLREGSAGSE